MTKNETAILQYIIRTNLTTKSRKRGKVDQRFYIAGYLHYKYGWGEQRIGEILCRDHSNINYAKKKPFELMYGKTKSNTFLAHTAYLRKHFPFKFPDPSDQEDESNAINTRATITVHLSKNQFEKLTQYKEDTGRDSYSATVQELIETFL